MFPVKGSIKLESMCLRVAPSTQENGSKVNETARASKYGPMVRDTKAHGSKERLRE